MQEACESGWCMALHAALASSSAQAAAADTGKNFNSQQLINLYYCTQTALQNLHHIR